MQELTELVLLSVFLAISAVIAPLMTNSFFLNNSKVYSYAHKIVLLIVTLGVLLNLNSLAVFWLLFCVFALFMYLKNEYLLIYSVKGLVTYIPFIFSIISSLWFFAGVNDLQLLGYNKAWSFYASLHGSFLGWIFLGCIAFLSRKSKSTKFYIFGCYLSFILFLLVAFGIDGAPYIKQIGVIGLSVIVPFLIGLYTFNLEKENRLSRSFAALSLFSIVISMILAVLNEFGGLTPRFLSGIPIMVVTHGLMNAIFTIPCFFLAIQFDNDASSQ